MTRKQPISSLVEFELIRLDDRKVREYSKSVKSRVIDWLNRFEVSKPNDVRSNFWKSNVEIGGGTPNLRNTRLN